MRIPAAAVMAVFLLTATISDLAQAADPGQGKVEVQIYGAGTASCGTWLADHESLMHSHELSWVLGFLTASENFTESLGVHLRLTDVNAISAWVDSIAASIR